MTELTLIDGSLGLRHEGVCLDMCVCARAHSILCRLYHCNGALTAEELNGRGCSLKTALQEEQFEGKLLVCVVSH